MANYDNPISINRQASYYFDWTTFLFTTMLVAIGLISIYSATYDSGMSSFFFKQLIITGAGYILMFSIMFVPERWINTLSIYLYGFSILLLIIVLFFGTKVAGTKGWLSLGFFPVQPAEFAKLTTLVFIARFLSMKGIDIKNLRDVLVILGILLLPVVLIALQPDTGSASVFLAMLLGVLFWSGFDLFSLFAVISLPFVALVSLMGNIYYIIAVSVCSFITILSRRKLITTIGVIASLIIIGYLSPLLIDNLMPHQKGRIETFLNPGFDPRGKGYNVIQSILAVGSGGFSGKGFMQGTQTQLRYIPKQWTDFIYCVPTEEFGFIGGAIVILLFVGLLYRALRIASEIDSKFMSIIIFGSASIIFYHVIINIGMAIGMLPVMGIPLPFLSYGGTSMIVNLTFVGFLLNSYRNYRKKKE